MLLMLYIKNPLSNIIHHISYREQTVKLRHNTPLLL